MEKIVTYRAFDGEEFDTKKECEQYENSLNITGNKGILMLDSYLREIAGEGESALNSVAYLFFNSKDSILSYNECAKYFGYAEVCDDYYGMWLEYDETLNVWENIDRRIDKLTELKKSLYKVKEDIDGNN